MTRRAYTVDPRLAADVMRFGEAVRHIAPPPTPGPYTLYRFYDRNDVLLYVGITGQGVLRWAQHARDKAWWTEVATITLTHYDSRPAVEHAERIAIRFENPLYNIVRR